MQMVPVIRNLIIYQICMNWVEFLYLKTYILIYIIISLFMFIFIQLLISAINKVGYVLIFNKNDYTEHLDN